MAGKFRTYKVQVFADSPEEARAFMEGILGPSDEVFENGTVIALWSEKEAD